jgi:MFS family permease
VEGGVLPVTLVLIRNWFARPERARANAIFLMGTILASAIGNPISGLAVAAFGWRMMFIGTAIPAVAWIFVWWWAIADHPDEVTWLPENEKTALIAALAEEKRGATAIPGHWFTVVWHPAVLMLTLYNLLGLIAIQALFIWLPSVFRETGRSIGAVGLLSAVPYIASAVLMVLVSRHSDRTRERKWHVVVPTMLSGPYLFGYLRMMAGNFSLALVIAGIAMIGAGLVAAMLRMPDGERAARRMPATLGRGGGP